MNQPDIPQKDHYAARDANRKLKFGIIAVIVGLVILGGISMLLISLLDKLDAQLQNKEQETQKGSSVIWVERSDDYNVFEDEEYLALFNDKQKEIPQIMLIKELSGESEELNEKNIDKYGDAVPVIYNMIRHIIHGDADAYNKLFSAKYYKDHDPEDSFRMQPLYDVEIIIPEGSSAEDGITYIVVKYKIYGNDGTFRTDIGHREAREQVFILSNTPGKGVLIDDIR